MCDGLTWLPAWRIRELIELRDVSCADVTDHFLARIERLNPVLHAFEEVDADGARKQAERVDAAVGAGEPLGPLHGIPFAVKSHIQMEGVRLTTPTGSIVAGFDDVGVERLHRASS